MEQLYLCPGVSLPRSETVTLIRLLALTLDSQDVVSSHTVTLVSQYLTRPL